jgi:hypothetical protein
MRSLTTIAIPIALVVLAAGCGSSAAGDRASLSSKVATGGPGDRLPEGSEPAKLDPAN